MAVSVTFKSHVPESERVIRVATSRAMNRAGISARAAGAREMHHNLGLRIGAIKEQIKIARSTPATLELKLSVRGRRIPLIEFSARGPEPSRGRGRGVSYKIGAGRRRIQTAFIATMRSGHRGVFKRVRRSRLPIVELLGPSLVIAFVRKPTVEAMNAKFVEGMTTNLGREISFAVAEP